MSNDIRKYITLCEGMLQGNIGNNFVNFLLSDGIAGIVAGNVSLKAWVLSTSEEFDVDYRFSMGNSLNLDDSAVYDVVLYMSGSMDISHHDFTSDRYDTELEGVIELAGKMRVVKGDNDLQVFIIFDDTYSDFNNEGVSVDFDKNITEKFNLSDNETIADLVEKYILNDLVIPAISIEYESAY